ncbi:MAG: LamG domain-containing protein [Candidatus Neomarinimicrobiota bacterium]|jgi:hypothetical protein
MAEGQIPLLPLQVGYFKTYEEKFSHFEVELYSSRTPRDANGGIDISRKHGDTVLLKGARSGYMYVSGTHTFEGLAKGYYYYIRYRVVTLDGRYSQWKSEQQHIGDSSITFVPDEVSVTSENGNIIASISINPSAIPKDFKQLHWFVRPSDFTDDIPNDTVPDYISDSVPSDGIFLKTIPASENKKVYFIAVDYSLNKHATTASLVGTVAAVTAPSVPTIVYSDRKFKFTFSYNFTTNPDTQEFRFYVSRDNSATFESFQIMRSAGIGAVDVVWEIPAIYDRAGNICYLRHQVFARNSIGMESTGSALTQNDALIPTNGFTSVSLSYEMGLIKLQFMYPYADPNNGNVHHFKVNVVETNSGKTWFEDIATTSTRLVTDVHQKNWEIQYGEIYTVTLYAVDIMGIISDVYADAGDIRAPFPEAVINEHTTAFIPYDLGYGSTRGLYHSEDTLFPIRTDGLYGGCLECFEVPSTVLEYATQSNIMVDFKGNVHAMKSYYFNGSSYIEIQNDDDLNVGTGDFSILFTFKPSSIVGTQYICNKEASGVGYGVLIDGASLYIRFDDGTTDVSGLIAEDVFIADTVYDVAVTFDRDGNATAYINGESAGTKAISSASLTLSNNGNFRIGSSVAGTDFFSGEVFRSRLFNLVSTQPEVQEFAAGNLPYKYKGASQTAIYASSGDFTDDWTIGGGAEANVASYNGKSDVYQFTVDGASSAHHNNKSGFPINKAYRLDFSYYIPSGQSNVDGVYVSNGVATNYTTTDAWTDVSVNFVSNAETKIRFYASDGGVLSFQDAGADDVFYIHGVSITQIGAVLDLNPENIFDNIWYDSSGNNLYVTNHGATVQYELADTYDAKFFLGGMSEVIPPQGLYYEADFENAIINNLVTNPEFESDTTGWTASGCILDSVSGGYRGNCLELENIDASYAWQSISDLVAGDFVRAECYVHSGSYYGKTVRFSLYSGADFNDLLSEVSFTPTTTWQRLSISGVVSAGDTAIRIVMGPNAGSTWYPSTVYFDSVKVYKVATSDYLFSLYDKTPTGSTCRVLIYGQEVISGIAYGAQSSDHLKDARQAFEGVVAGDLVKNLATGNAFIVSSPATGDLTLVPAGSAFSEGDAYEVITHRGSGVPQIYSANEYGLLCDEDITGIDEFNKFEIVCHSNYYDNRFVIKIIPDPDNQNDGMYLDYVFGLKTANPAYE